MKLFYRTRKSDKSSPNEWREDKIIRGITVGNGIMIPIYMTHQDEDHKRNSKGFLSDIINAILAVSASPVTMFSEPEMTHFMSDGEAIRSDWEEVGQYLYRGILDTYVEMGGEVSERNEP